MQYQVGRTADAVGGRAVAGRAVRTAGLTCLVHCRPHEGRAGIGLTETGLAHWSFTGQVTPTHPHAQCDPSTLTFIQVVPGRERQPVNRTYHQVYCLVTTVYMFSRQQDSRDNFHVGYFNLDIMCFKSDVNCFQLKLIHFKLGITAFIWIKQGVEAV